MFRLESFFTCSEGTAAWSNDNQFHYIGRGLGVMVLVVVAPYLRFDTRGGIVGALIRGLPDGLDGFAHSLGL